MRDVVDQIEKSGIQYTDNLKALGVQAGEIVCISKVVINMILL